MLDVQQRGVPSHQRGGRALGSAEPPGHVERLVGELERASPGARSTRFSARRASTRTRSTLSSGPSADSISLEELRVRRSRWPPARRTGRPRRAPRAPSGSGEPSSRASRSASANVARGLGSLACQRAAPSASSTSQRAAASSRPTSGRTAEHALVVLDRGLVGVGRLSRHARSAGCTRSPCPRRRPRAPRSSDGPAPPGCTGRGEISSASATRRCRRTRRLAIGRS